VKEATSKGTALAAGLDLVVVMIADAEDLAAQDPIPEALQEAEEEIVKEATLLKEIAEEVVEIEETRAGLLKLVRAEAAQEATARAATGHALHQDLSLDPTAAANLSHLETPGLQRRKMAHHLSLPQLNLV